MQMDREAEGFFVVWCPEGVTPPKVKHASRVSAEREAERLAHANHGSLFFVLSAVSVSEVPRITRALAEPIPF